MGSFSYTSRAGLSREVLSHIPCWIHFYLGSFSYTSRASLSFILEVSLTHPVLASFYLGSFSHTSHTGFVFIWGVSLTHPVLASLLSVEFLLHIPCCLYFSVWSFSYISQAGFFSFFRKTFNLVTFSYTSRVGFIFIWGVSLTHPVMAWPLSGEFILHIPCWL